MVLSWTPGSPKVKVQGTSHSSQWYSGGEDGPSSLERSTDSRCISQGFPHLKLANEHEPLNMSLVTLKLKPPTTRAQDSKNESDDDNHRQDRGGNRHYGYRPLSARPGQTRIGSRQPVWGSVGMNWHNGQQNRCGCLRHGYRSTRAPISQ